MTPAYTDSLWPHQREAVDAVTRAIGTAGRAQVVMACGTGKTRVGAHVARELAAVGRTLVVVPTVELLYQTIREYQHVLNLPAEELIGVCSARSAATTAEDDEISELAAHGVLVSTDPTVLSDALHAADTVIAVTTYASLSVIAQISSGAAPWDLVVIDEAHRSAGAEGRAWSVVHDDTAIPARRRLSLTATPRIYRNGDTDVISMDDTAVFGPPVHRLSFSEAISRQLLADYRVVAGVVDDTELARFGHLTADGQVVTVDGHAMSPRMVAAQIALIRAIDEHGLTRVVTYHSSVAESRRFAATLLNTADLLDRPHTARHIAAEHIDGKTPLDERRFVLNKLHHPGHRRTVVISNCRVLAEGVDVPELDGVLFAAPRDSTIDIMQAIGRALRRGAQPDKTATIIVPVLTSTSESADHVLEGSEWRVLWKVMRALRGHDERLGETLDDCRTHMSGRRGRDTGDRLARWLTTTGIAVTPELAQAIRLRTVKAASSAWWEGYGHACDFYAEHGSLDDLRNDYHTPDGFPLGQWVVNRSTEVRRGEISAAYIEPLAKLGIGVERETRWWRRGIRALRAFRDREGHVNVPKGHVERGVRLTTFLEARRREYRKGLLSDSRASELRALGVSLDPHAERRETALRELDRYLRDHPERSRPPTGWTTDSGFKLGQWVNNRIHEAKAGTLHPDVEHALRKRGILAPVHHQRAGRSESSPAQ